MLRHLAVLAASTSMAFLAAVPVARGACEPPVTVCPASPQPSAPQISSAAATAVSDTTVTLSATINPDGLQTNYDWDLYSFYDRRQPAASGSLSPGYEDQTIQTRLTGLEPDTQYSFELAASNSEGTAYAGGGFRTTTNLKVGLSVRDPAIVVGVDNPRMKLTITLSGDYSSHAEVLVDVAPPPYRHWLTLESSYRARRLLTVAPCRFGCSGLDRNSRLRVQVGTVDSRSVRVDVYPDFSFSVSREGAGGFANASPWVDDSLSATVHAGAGYRPTTVFFYQSSSRSGPFHLVGARRLRRGYASGGLLYLHAHLRFYDPTAGAGTWCIRRQLLPDMGRHFRNRRCGRPVLP